jgi:hypothetical protein
MDCQQISFINRKQFANMKTISGTFDHSAIVAAGRGEYDKLDV